MKSVSVMMRRRSVERLLCMGWQHAVIAEELGVQLRTVYDDSHAILQRRGMSSQLELVVAAFKAGQEVLGER